MRKKTPMDFQEVVRKQRPMKAVQITFSNAAEVAAWCEGIVVMSTVRLGGTDTQLPAVQLNRPSKGGRDYTTALVTFWIVQYPGEFRIFKDAQYQALFDTMLEPIPGSSVDNPIVLREGDYVFQNTGVAVMIPDNALTKISPDKMSAGLGGGLPELLQEGIARTKAVEEFQKIRQLEELRLHSVGPIPKSDESGWIISDEEAARVAAVSFGEGSEDEGKHTLRETDPFKESENPTPAGESLEFEAGQRVKVIDTDTDFYDQTGTVVVVGVDHAHAADGIEVEFDEGLGTEKNPKVSFHPTQLKRV